MQLDRLLPLMNTNRAPDIWTAMQAIPDLIHIPQPGLNRTNILAFEAFWPHPIPPHVSAWFSIVASAAVGSQFFRLVRDAPEGYGPYSTFVEYAWPEQGWLVVGGDGSGDYYVVQTQPGPLRGSVAFIDQANIGTLAYLVASSFHSWLRLLAYREAGGPLHWPFNPAVFQQYDPAFLQITPEALLPWRHESGAM